MSARACLPESLPHKPQSVAALLARAVQQLAPTSDSPRADASILLAHALERNKEWLIAHGESVPAQAECEAFAALCEKRASGVPVAYLTGLAGFYGREFTVNESVLVPRPETEHLVEDALAHLRGRSQPSVLDVGAGSGAIACSIAAEVPDAVVEGTDVSEAALSVARENARRLGVNERCTFHLADLVRPNAAKPYDVVVANLPYVPSADVPRKPDPAGYEPAGALDGGLDGLDLYRRLLEHVPRLLASGGLLLMEAAPPTIDALAELARRALPEANVEVRRDYGGRDRYVRATCYGGHRSG